MNLAIQRLDELVDSLKKVTSAPGAQKDHSAANMILDELKKCIPMLHAFESVNLLTAWHAAGNGSYEEFEKWYVSTYNLELQIEPKQQL